MTKDLKPDEIITRELDGDASVFSSLREVFGSNDAYLKRIESALQVDVVDRNGRVKIVGRAANVAEAEELFKNLTRVTQRGGSIDEQKINYAIDMELEHQGEVIASLGENCICHTVSGRPIAPKTLGQSRYVEAMTKRMIVFGLGPAGTGKTYLAMAMAVTAFKKEEVSRIILTRPAIEAGEKLGFLPGDLQSKVDPYLRPLYDALYQIMGAENFSRNMEKGAIEVAPLAYMRGRTLDNSFIILDEAQNTTPAQMKMFLTRIGFGSKAIITGDETQKDLPKDAVSGLDVAVKVLKDIDDISICRLDGRDVVRHPLVQKIVGAYEDYEAKAAAKNKKGAKHK